MRIWIGIACFAVIVVPALVYRGWLDGQMLRADADTIPLRSGLMSYGVAYGGREFAAHCAACHGSEARGDSRRGVPNLTDADWLYGVGAVSEIERTVTYGIRSDNPKAWNLASMPAFATPRPSASNPKITPLDPPQIRDVIEYLYFLQGRSQNADAVERGAAIYGNSGACYDCHSADARGDPAVGAPNLIDKINLYGDGSRDALFDSIAVGRQGICPAWINKMSPAAVRAASLYIYSLSHPQRVGTLRSMP